VGFSAGGENLHGVNAVKRGRRCALALWFTFDAHYNEVERYLAQQVLIQVKKKGSISEQLLYELKKHVPLNAFSDFKDIH
jgi:leucine proline-enriched proteoglycan (leprecan)